jgi:hypothetical protein
MAYYFKRVIHFIDIIVWIKPQLCSVVSLPRMILPLMLPLPNLFHAMFDVKYLYTYIYSILIVGPNILCFGVR